MRQVGAAMTLSVICLVGTNAPVQAEPGGDALELRVRTHAESTGDGALLADAMAAAGRVFADAGMRLEWTQCDPDGAGARCDGAPAANEFIVRLRRARVDGASHGCGVSLRPQFAPGHYITVFLDCVLEGAESFGVSAAIVLAYVVAHEVGHLLLPVGHSPAGVMRARPDRLDWQRAARGALRFHPADEARMRAMLRDRTAAANQ